MTTTAEIEPTNDARPASPGSSEPEDAFEIHEDDDGRVNAVTFKRPGKQPLTRFRRDNDSDDEAPWFELMEQLQPALKKRRQLIDAVNTVHTAIEPHLPYLEKPEDPPPIEWTERPLPGYYRDQINDVYFLVVEQGTHDVHGNLYSTNCDDRGKPLREGGKAGSMCAGKFPHAVMPIKKEYRSKDVEPQFVVTACTVIELVVRLFKRGPNGTATPSSEKELLAIIKDAHNGVQDEEWTDLENRMFLHLNLCWGNTRSCSADPPPGTPVYPSAFQVPPAHGVLDPPESPYPRLLRKEPPSFYEFEMIDGVARIRFRLNGAATSPSLKDQHKLRPFRFGVRAMNPFLPINTDFNILTVPFFTKNKLARYCNANERYVLKDGQITASPAGDARIPTPYPWDRRVCA